VVAPIVSPFFRAHQSYCVSIFHATLSQHPCHVKPLWPRPLLCSWSFGRRRLCSIFV